MSWSVSRSGRAGKVREHVKTDLERLKCVEPEESVKNMAGQAIDTALAAMPEDQPVKVEAFGSQVTTNGIHVNQLKVEVAPFWGWLE